jgi:hypothetical protein
MVPSPFPFRILTKLLGRSGKGVVGVRPYYELQDLKERCMPFARTRGLRQLRICASCILVPRYSICRPHSPRPLSGQVWLWTHHAVRRGSAKCAHVGWLQRDAAMNSLDRVCGREWRNPLRLAIPPTAPRGCLSTGHHGPFLQMRIRKRAQRARSTGTAHDCLGLPPSEVSWSEKMAHALPATRHKAPILRERCVPLGGTT